MELLSYNTTFALRMNNEHLYTAVLLLGGNIGNTRSLFQKAITLINDAVGGVVDKSSLYQSDAWGFDSDDAFLNQVVVCHTKLDPWLLLDECLLIEKQLGRTRRNSDGYESRIIDIDILFYGDFICKDAFLSIPHPRLHLRNFTLHPLCELMPQFEHPLLKKNMLQLLHSCPDVLSVRKLC